MSGVLPLPDIFHVKPDYSLPAPFLNRLQRDLTPGSLPACKKHTGVIILICVAYCIFLLVIFCTDATQSVTAAHNNKSTAIASAAMAYQPLNTRWTCISKFQKEKQKHLKNSVHTYCSLFFILLHMEEFQVKAFARKVIRWWSEIPLEIGTLHTCS